MPSGAPLSIWDLFQNADLVVKLVMIGLLVASIMVWAIAIEKLILYSRTRRAMDGFEQAFWSGESIEELYRALSAKPTIWNAGMPAATWTCTSTPRASTPSNATVATRWTMPTPDKPG